MRYSKGLPAEAFWATGDPFAYPIVLLPAEQDFIQERFSCERVCGPPGVHPFADYREGFCTRSRVTGMDLALHHLVVTNRPLHLHLTTHWEL